MSGVSPEGRGDVGVAVAGLPGFDLVVDVLHTLILYPLGLFFILARA